MAAGPASAGALPADWRDFVAADQAAGDDTGRLHRALRPAGGAGCDRSGDRLHRGAVHRSGRRGGRRAQPVVRGRYRRDDAPHPRSAVACRADDAPGGAALRRRYRGFFGAADGAGGRMLAAAILLASILFYVLVYTVWLKRRTPQNIVIGGAAGAFPPLIGWVAATGRIELDAGAAVRDDLPVDAAAFLGAVAVRPLAITPLPACRCCRSSPACGTPAFRCCSTACRWRPPRSRPGGSGLAGVVYGAHRAGDERDLRAAGAAGRAESRDRSGGDAVERRLFAYSIAYLFILFGALVVDHRLLG